MRFGVDGIGRGWFIDVDELGRELGKLSGIDAAEKPWLTCV